MPTKQVVYYVPASRSLGLFMCAVVGLIMLIGGIATLAIGIKQFLQYRRRYRGHHRLKGTINSVKSQKYEKDRVIGQDNKLHEVVNGYFELEIGYSIASQTYSGQLTRSERVRRAGAESKKWRLGRSVNLLAAPDNPRDFLLAAEVKDKHRFSFMISVFGFTFGAILFYLCFSF
jgi:hypothetical protein